MQSLRMEIFIPHKCGHDILEVEGLMSVETVVYHLCVSGLSFGTLADP